MNELEMKRIEVQSAQLLSKLNPLLERVDVWVLAATISRMLDTCPPLLPLVYASCLATMAENERSRQVDSLMAPPKPGQHISLLINKPVDEGPEVPLFDHEKEPA